MLTCFVCVCCTAGAVESGKAFDDAVQKIKDSGNKDELATLTGAGIDVNNVTAAAN